MIVKVDGVSNADNIRKVVKAGACLVNLMLSRNSRHGVRMVNSQSGIVPDIVPRNISELQESLSDGMHKVGFVGTFADDMPQHIITCIYNFKLDYVQLQGEESRIMIENLRSSVVPDISADLKVIKVIKVAKASDFVCCDEYEGVVDCFLFDMQHDATAGGFDMGLIDAYCGSTPFLVGGCSTPDVAEQLKKVSHQLMAGISLDCHSGKVGQEGIEEFVANIAGKLRG